MKVPYLLLVILPTSMAFAQLFQCPSTNAYIQTGDSIQTVVQKCGQPVAYRNRNAQTVAQNSYLLWEYNQTMSNPRQRTAAFYAKARPFFDVLFHDGKVGAMRIRGQNQFLQNHACKNGPINIGDTMQQVTMMCGLPEAQKVIQLGKPSGGTSPQDLKPATILTYQPNSYSATQSLVFENNQLVGIS